MAYSVFRVPNSIQVLPTTGNQIVSTVIGASGQSVDMEQWQNYLGTVLARVDSAGNISGVGATFSGSAAINGGSVTTSASTANLFNSATTLNLGTASTNVYVGSVGTTNVNILTATGQINANNGTIATNQSSATLFATPTTVSAFAAATTLNLATTAVSSAITIGSSTSTTTIAGNLIVNGTTTTVNSTTINIDDLNLNLASDSGTIATADGGGITIGSGLGITLNYEYNSNNPQWTSSQNFNIATTKAYRIAGTDVLNATGIGSSVVLSSLQKVGTIATGVWQGTSISTTYTDAKVVSVSGASNGARIVIGGTASIPTVDLATVSQSTGSSFVKVTIDSYGRITGNSAVVSGDIPNLSASQITAGTLAVAQGGTNLGSYGTGVLLQASGTTISQLSPTTSGYFLRTNGANTFSTYGALTSGDVTTALGFTPVNTSNGITGAGTTGKVTLWNGTNTVTSDTELAYDSTSNILSIAHGNITASNSTLTIGTTGTDVIDSFGTGVYRTAKYLLQARNSGSTEFQISEVLVVHDNTTAYLTEYGKVYTGANPLLASLAVSIAAPNVSFTATAATAGTVVRFSKITMNN